MECLIPFLEGLVELILHISSILLAAISCTRYFWKYFREEENWTRILHFVWQTLQVQVEAETVFFYKKCSLVCGLFGLVSQH